MFHQSRSGLSLGHGVQLQVNGGRLGVLVAGAQRLQYCPLSSLLAHIGLLALPNDDIIKTDDDYQCAEHLDHPAPREHYHCQFLVLPAFKPGED